MVHKINFKSEFSLRLTLITQTGERIDSLPADWEASFITDGIGYCFKASSKGGVLRNCNVADGVITVVFDRHHLSPGLLRVEFKTDLPNKSYPDGIRSISESRALDIRLVADSSTVIPEILTAVIPLPVTLDEIEGVANPPQPGDTCECLDYEPFSDSEIKEIIEEIRNEEV